MTHNSVTSVPVSFDDAGRGEPALVYLTGWCGARTSYAAMVEHTARHYRSIAIDWRGHGTSPAADGDFGWPQLADDVLAVLDSCGVDQFVPVTMLERPADLASDLTRFVGSLGLLRQGGGAGAR